MQYLHWSSISTASFLLLLSVSTAYTVQNPKDDCTIIDGKKDPGQIPDDAAIRVALGLLGDGPSSPSYADRVVLVQGYGFNEREIVRLMKAANDWRSADAAIIQRSRILLQDRKKDVALPKAVLDQIKANGEERVSVCSRISSELQSDLGAAGWEKFMKFISNKIKPTTTYCKPN